MTQRLPITPQNLISMSGFVDFSNSFHVSVWSTILVMFFSFLRKSNVLPDSPKTFDPTRQLSRSSISVDPLGQFLIVKVTWSKTIQYYQRVMY